MVNILFVEDDLRILTKYTNILHGMESNINVIPAHTGEEALALLDKNSIDGALIDIGLPGMDGFALAKKIRDIENYHLLPIVFETAEDRDVPETYKKYHNIDYIKKPFSIAAFTSMASRLLKEIELQKRIIRKNETRTIAFLHDEGIAYIRFSDVLFAKSTLSRKTVLVTRSSEFSRSRFPMARLIEEINEELFVQCHKSCVVNVSNIEYIKQTSGRSWDIYFGDSFPETCQLSLRYKKDIENLLHITKYAVNKV